MKTIMQWSVHARYSNCARLEIWDSPKTLGNWVLYYRDDPLDPCKFGASPKFLAIGSHSTEMIPLIQ
jgi:hypothetical protein